MEKEVMGALEGEENDDMVLMSLLDYTMTSLVEKRPIFPNLADEPVFYRRYFRKWVKDYIDEQQQIAEAQEEVKKMMNI
jgi:hypothetical protein